jgi:hypothetical protein
MCLPSGDEVFAIVFIEAMAMEKIVVGTRSGALSLDEYIFFSTLPQALSTEAEMMTRYTIDEPDGKRASIQRIHVTGGTNGILIHSLRRYRPFPPTLLAVRRTRPLSSPCYPIQA